MTSGGVNSRRADTRRNHERILAAGLAALTSTGEISLNTIARQAEVGVGTVYRHFPTPEALVLAVYRREVQHLVDIVPGLLAEHPPAEAFHRWTGHLAQYMMTKRGLAGALSIATTSDQELFSRAHETVLAAVTTLLAANEAAGAIRPGLDPATVLRALAGVLHLSPGGDWRTEAESLTDLLWHGMRAQP
jgi:AcrR family transcriptional regulator